MGFKPADLQTHRPEIGNFLVAEGRRTLELCVVMLDVPVYTVEGNEVGQMSVDERVLGGRVRPALLAQAVVMYQANRRQGTAATRNRSSVRGSTRKLFRQKGTGRARMGAVRTPVRRGGGRAFAKCARDFGKRMPKRMRRLAFKNALLARVLDRDVLVLDDLHLEQPKTRTLVAVLRAVGASAGCVLTVAEPNEAVLRSGRGIPNTLIRVVDDLNAYDMLCRKKVLFTKAAFERLTQRLSAQEN